MCMPCFAINDKPAESNLSFLVDLLAFMIQPGNPTFFVVRIFIFIFIFTNLGWDFYHQQCMYFRIYRT